MPMFGVSFTSCERRQNNTNNNTKPSKKYCKNSQRTSKWMYNNNNIRSTKNRRPNVNVWHEFYQLREKRKQHQQQHQTQRKILQILQWTSKKQANGCQRCIAHCKQFVFRMSTFGVTFTSCERRENNTNNNTKPNKKYW